MIIGIIFILITIVSDYSFDNIIKISIENWLLLLTATATLKDLEVEGSSCEELKHVEVESWWIMGFLC